MKKENNYVDTTAKRYNRIARFYDLTENIVEKSRYSAWRELLWSKVEGKKILEIGVGTGKNFVHYPENVEITAIDFSEKMLRIAIEKAKKQDIEVKLHLMDVQSMSFENDTFDSVVATFVFCSVPDPVKGLEEINRVCKPDGKILLLEHVLSPNHILGLLMKLVNPLVVRMMGANINRETVNNVSKSGLKVEKVTDLAAGIFKLIEVRE